MTQKRKFAKLKRARPNYKSMAERLIADVLEVRQYRQMNASESPAMQTAWERLNAAVLESEQLLYKPVDKLTG